MVPERGVVEAQLAQRLAQVVVRLARRDQAEPGVLRVERDRQGGMRVFPGANLKPAAPPVEDVDVTAEPAVETVPVVVEPDVATEPPIIDVEPVESPAETVTLEEPPRRGGRKRKATSGGSKRKTSKSVSAKHSARRGRSKSDAADKATQIA